MPLMARVRSAAVYARISSDQDGTALGVKRQVADCRRLAGELGWPVGEEYPIVVVSGGVAVGGGAEYHAGRSSTKTFAGGGTDCTRIIPNPWCLATS